jgi:hypothetical protein
MNSYSLPAQVEEYIEGREITVGLVGNCMDRSHGYSNDVNCAHQSGLRLLPPWKGPQTLIY